MHYWFRIFLRHVSAVLILNPATEKRPFGRAYIIHIGVWIGRSSDVIADKLKTRAILELDSLEPRLLHLDLVLAYKLIFGLAEIESYTLFEFRSDCITRGHDYKLTAHNNRVNVRKWYFSQRLINVWNSLLVNADCIASLSRFKSFLVKADLSAFLLLPLND
jgi:hypothetical protein